MELTGSTPHHGSTSSWPDAIRSRYSLSFAIQPPLKDDELGLVSPCRDRHRFRYDNCLFVHASNLPKKCLPILLGLSIVHVECLGAPDQSPVPQYAVQKHLVIAFLSCRLPDSPYHSPRLCSCATVNSASLPTQVENSSKPNGCWLMHVSCGVSYTWAWATKEITLGLLCRPFNCFTVRRGGLRLSRPSA
jgi:hypothetical protein